MATHPCILAWRIPWTEEPGRSRKESDTTEQLTIHTHTTHAYNMECCKSMESQRVWHDWAAKHTVITWLCFIFGTGGVNSYVTVLWWRKAWFSLWCWCHQASILSKDTLDSLTHAPADRAVPGSAAAWLWRLYYTRASLQRHSLNIQEFYLMMRTSDIFSGELS